MLLAAPASLMYFANYAASPFSFRSNEAGALLVLRRDGPALLVADNLLDVYAAQACVDEIATPTWYSGETSPGHRLANLVAQATKIVDLQPGAQLAVEFSSVPYGLVAKLQERLAGRPLTNVDPLLPPLRRAKDADEIALIRRSLDVATHALRSAMQQARPGMTELDLFRLVQRAAGEKAGEPVSIYGDFVSGSRCESIGGPPSDRVLRSADLVLLDFSVVLRGYRGDFANTFVCGGPPTTRQVELFETCVAAMNAGEKKLRAGAACREVDAAVRLAFRDRDLNQFFPHHVGHGVGLGHPEAPFFVPASADTLIAGDVVTLEPGLYLPGVAGMRYERDYLITDTGFEVLSDHPISIFP